MVDVDVDAARPWLSSPLLSARDIGLPGLALLPPMLAMDEVAVGRCPVERVKYACFDKLSRSTLLPSSEL